MRDVNLQTQSMCRSMETLEESAVLLGSPHIIKWSEKTGLSKQGIA